MKEVSLSNGAVAIVDDEDYERVLQYTWHWCNGYAARKLRRVGGHRPSEYLHRFIMHAERGQQIDHANRNKLDCRRCNLRFCTPAQNLANSDRKRRIAPFKNVHQDKRTGHWRVTMRINGKRVSLGVFATAMDAALAHDEMARRVHGEFALCNF